MARRAQSKGRQGRPLDERERRLVLEEFHAGGSLTAIVDRIAARFDQEGLSISRRSIQRHVAMLDWITRHRLREPLTDEQWQTADQEIRARHGVTRWAVDAWIKANAEWEQQQAQAQLMELAQVSTGLPSAGARPRPRLADLFLAEALRGLERDLMEFISYRNDEWRARQETLLRHLQTLQAATPPDGEPGRPGQMERLEPAHELAWLAARFMGSLKLHFFEQLERSRVMEALILLAEPLKWGDPSALPVAHLRYGLYRWAAFVAACRLMDLAVQQALAPDWRWLELAGETTSIEGYWALLRPELWFGKALDLGQLLQLRRFVWNIADAIWRKEAVLPDIDDVHSVIMQLADAWKRSRWEA